ncbi:MAG: diguanylate cyclase domain-containing protein, partial [Vicinamibacterales bacterium]
APSDADRAAASEAGADAYVTWPAGSDMLREELDSAEHLVRARTVPGKGARPDEERFLVINPDGSIRRAASIAEQLLGFPPEALAGVNAFGFFHVDDAPQLLSIVTEALVHSGPTRVIEARVRRDGDTWRTIAISAVNLLADPATGGIAFDLRGPDARINIDDQVTRAAMHDRVTDLPNRSLFIDRVDHAIARAGRRQQPVVVMAVDFNDFAPSDERGSADVNDGLVIAVAQRLRSCLRTSDTAARLGSDDFGLLLEDIADLSHVDIVANRIIKAMTVPFVDGGDEITFTPNIGIVVSSPERNRAVDLLRDSGIAKAWALVQGSGRFVMFDPSMRPPDGEP